MPFQPGETNLSVEQEAAPPGQGPRRLRLTATFRSEGTPPTAAELAEAIGRLDRELSEATRLAGFVSSTPSRADRPLTELIEVYRPRQPELVELLLADGELTNAEADSLRQYLAGPLAAAPPAPPPREEVVPVTDRPIAAAPLEGDRTPSRARPVQDLLREYRIESLRQAGAVRARRQISFEEYMALKRHFAPSEGTAEPSERPA
jgi:hypothetical protein